MSRELKQQGLYVRGAYHSGSWYQDDAEDLGKVLETLLSKVALPMPIVQGLTGQQQQQQQQEEDQEQEPGTRTRDLRLRAIVCPHAGYTYSGPTAAFPYQALRYELSSSASSSSASSLPSRIQTIVVLHPSHHVYLDGCAVSGARVVETPVGNLNVDEMLREEILQFGRTKNQSYNNKMSKFSIMSQSDDEHEHSGEMQYPFIAQILQQLDLLNQVRILPIMCGALSVEQEIHYGRTLASILDRNEILTVISTDFCHWGSRFRYNPTPPAGGGGGDDKMPIHEFIAQLDRRGMDLIAAQTPGAFADYLKQTRNTICGRHAVAVWLRAIEASSSVSSSVSAKKELEISFVKYAQSSAVTSLRDSSVSYAGALATQRCVATG